MSVRITVSTVDFMAIVLFCFVLIDENLKALPYFLFNFPGNSTGNTNLSKRNHLSFLDPVAIDLY